MTIVWPALILVLGLIGMVLRSSAKRRVSAAQSRPQPGHHYVSCPECGGEGKRTYSDKHGRVDCGRCDGLGGWQEPDAA